MDKKKIVIISLIFAAFLLYLVASLFTDIVFGWFNIAVTRDYILTIPEFIGVVLAVTVFIVTVKNAVAMEFLHDVVIEMAKVVYPTPKESGQSALVVVGLVGIATFVLAIYDVAWSFFTRLILSVGGA